MEFHEVSECGTADQGSAAVSPSDSQVGLGHRCTWLAESRRALRRLEHISPGAWREIRQSDTIRYNQWQSVTISDKQIQISDNQIQINSIRHPCKILQIVCHVLQVLSWLSHLFELLFSLHPEEAELDTCKFVSASHRISLTVRQSKPETITTARRNHHMKIWCVFWAARDWSFCLIWEQATIEFWK